MPTHLHAARRWLLLGCAASLLSPLAAQGPAWRFWARADGLTEPWTLNFTPDANGALWIKHGNVETMTIFDGYRISREPDPRVLRVRVRGTWAVIAEGVKHFAGGAWSLYPFPNASEFADLVAIMPRDSDRAFVLTATGLFEFSLPGGTYRAVRRSAQSGIGRFLGMSECRDGDLWVVGERGVARYQAAAGAPDWAEFAGPQLGLRDIKANDATPLAGFGGEVFLTGLSLESGKPAVVRFDGRHARTIMEGMVALMSAWPGSGGSCGSPRGRSRSTSATS